MSDSDEFPNSRYRTYSSQSQGRNNGPVPGGNTTASHQHNDGQQQRPGVTVRRVGSRQMLVLGDEASIHGNKSFGVFFFILRVVFVCRADGQRELGRLVGQ